jgi:2'-5' RNA ligase
MDTPVCNFFALVTYVPAPLGSVLDNLRQSLPGNHVGRAHITILPPRPLRVPCAVASQRARQILRDFAAFDVELNDIRLFSETDVLYLSLQEGNRLVHQMHDALNTGDLSDTEQFEFRPHVTLGGPIPHSAFARFRGDVENVWSSLKWQKRFTLSRIVALGAPSMAQGVEWRQLWHHDLGSKDQADYQSKGAQAGD